MFQITSQAATWCRAFAFGVTALASTLSFADTISPTSYSANLGVGESTTIRKTVVVEKSGPTSALVDIMFVFDTTGSMGGAIDGAKASATTVLTDLQATYGNVFSGVGQYDDPGRTILNNLTGTIATSQASINLLGACYGDCGGDYEEVGFAGIKLAADTAAWRAGSNRFIIAFGDAAFKTGPDAGADLAGTTAALAAANAKLFGVNVGFGGMAADITNLGGTNFSSGTSGTAIANAIKAAVTAGFASYKTVTVGDLNGGDPEIQVTTKCVSADIGACVGDSATGTYDRSVDRTFDFDVTFTRTASGDKAFDTYALVDRGIVATEKDRFGMRGSDVPEPGILGLLVAGLFGIGAARRRAAH